jgi:4-hydroxy 2-oxovalerate aldolase/long-chain acyl-CoA synthetase
MDNTQRKKIQILECTLRDGSYAIDYQFTAEDTAIITSGLEQAGFELIEIGHGLGLNASSPLIGLSAATDEEYLEAAAKSLKKAKFGMFFIPGIGRKKTLDLAAKYKMDFVRIGTNVTEVEQAEPYIKYAKELGFLVFSNLMKSYALPIDEFIKKAELASRYGADVIVVVDSAGGMMPEEVHNYISRIKREIGVKVGFHGHNNLLLAIANTVEAVKAGAEIVDSSLQGIGRSAGNAQTEILVMVLEKRVYST